MDWPLDVSFLSWLLCSLMLFALNIAFTVELEWHFYPQLRGHSAWALQADRLFLPWSRQRWQHHLRVCIHTYSIVFIKTGALGLGSGWFDPILPVSIFAADRWWVGLLYCERIFEQVCLFTDNSFSLLMDRKVQWIFRAAVNRLIEMQQCH